MVIRELTRSQSGFELIGCVDDDASKIGIQLHGVPVLGVVEDLELLVDVHSVDEILIAIPSASGKQMRRIAELCQKTKLPFKTVPTLSDIIGETRQSSISRSGIEDLLTGSRCKLV
jgi:FlaA1/EpsC-like NDP-sugar epimerase